MLPEEYFISDHSWLTSCTPEKLKEIKHEKARIALIGNKAPEGNTTSITSRKYLMHKL